MQRCAIRIPTAASLYPRVAYRNAHPQTQCESDLGLASYRTPPGCRHISVPRAGTRWPPLRALGPARSAVLRSRRCPQWRTRPSGYCLRAKRSAGPNGHNARAPTPHAPPITPACRYDHPTSATHCVVQYNNGRNASQTRSSQMTYYSNPRTRIRSCTQPPTTRFAMSCPRCCCMMYKPRMST